MDSFSLADTYLLRGATMGDVEAVQVISQVVEFKAGDQIVPHSDKNQDIMIVTSGRARVLTRDGDLICELRSGDMIGEISFLDGNPRTASVVSVGDAKLLIIPAVRLRQLMNEKPKLAITILKNVALALSGRLRDANQQVESLLIPR